MIQNFEIGYEWVNLTEMASMEAGKTYGIQPQGGKLENACMKTSDGKPDDSLIGFLLYDERPIGEYTPSEGEVMWCRKKNDGTSNTLTIVIDSLT